MSSSHPTKGAEVSPGLSVGKFPYIRYGRDAAPRTRQKPRLKEFSPVPAAVPQMIVGRFRTAPLSPSRSWYAASMPAPPVLLLALTYLGFVSLGLPDAVTGVIWPSAHREFGIPAGHLGTLLVAGAVGYMLSSLLAGRLLQLLGVGGLLASSCAVVTLALAGFAFAPVWPVFAACGVLSGLGSGAIDAGLNAFAARHFTPRHMSWLHAFWGVGATLGAATAAAAVASRLPWQATYMILGAAMVLMTLVFTLTLPRWQAGPAARHGEPHGEPPATMHEALRQPLVWAQMFAFFAYCGVEMTAGQWSFTLLTQFRDYPLAAAGTAVSVYWGSLTAGRFLLGTIVNRLGVRKLLRLAAMTALVGGLVFVLAPWPWLNALGLALLGFSLAPIYPGLMSQTPDRLGRFAEFAIGFQASAAMLGAVLIPTAGGLLLQSLGATWLNGLIGALVVTLWLTLLTLLRPQSFTRS